MEQMKNDPDEFKKFILGYFLDFARYSLLAEANGNDLLSHRLADAFPVLASLSDHSGAEADPAKTK